MTCAACGRPVTPVDWSDELGQALCDPCYGRVLSRHELVRESDAARAVAEMGREANARRAASR